MISLTHFLALMTLPCANSQEVNDQARHQR
jgi:hypothetical protein